MYRVVCLAIGACLIAACSTTPQPLATPNNPIIVPVPEFIAQQARLRENLAQGIPRELDETEWRRVDRIQREFDRLLAGVKSVDELSAADRNLLFNLTVRLDVLLRQGTEDELVCIREKALGTRMGPTQRCVPLSQLALERDKADYLMQHIETYPRGAIDF